MGHLHTGSDQVAQGMECQEYHQQVPVTCNPRSHDPLQGMSLPAVTLPEDLFKEAVFQKGNMACRPVPPRDRWLLHTLLFLQSSLSDTCSSILGDLRHSSTETSHCKGPTWQAMHLQWHHHGPEWAPANTDSHEHANLDGNEA